MDYSIRSLATLCASICLVGSALARSTHSAQGSATVEGRLAKAKSGFSLRAKPTNRGAVYDNVKANDFLVDVPFDSRWSKVLLRNGRYGYAPKDKLLLLGYAVTGVKGQVLRKIPNSK